MAEPILEQAKSMLIGALIATAVGAPVGVLVWTWQNNGPSGKDLVTMRSSVFERVQREGLEFLDMQDVYNQHLSELMIGARRAFPRTDFELLNPGQFEPVIAEVMASHPRRADEIEKWSESQQDFLTALSLANQYFSPEVASAAVVVNETTNAYTIRARLLSVTPESIADLEATQKAFSVVLRDQRDKNQGCLHSLCSLMSRELSADYKGAL